MPSRFLLRNFEVGQTYHLVHRAPSGQTLFKDQADYQSFLLTLSYYLRFPDGAPLSWVPRLSPKSLAKKQGESIHKGLVPCHLHAFLLLPDHYHLLLTENKGLTKAGISELMRRLSVGWAMTYRGKYGGKGTIYKGKYKMVKVDTNKSSSLIKYLHSHPDTNSAFLKDPLHTSFMDYENNPRSWLKTLPLSESEEHITHLTID